MSYSPITVERIVPTAPHDTEPELERLIRQAKRWRDRVFEEFRLAQKTVMALEAVAGGGCWAWETKATTMTFDPPAP
jgi:hypothetical protein